jgi:hypothetical protein
VATIQKADLLKRDNIKQMVDRVNDGGQFKLMSESGPAYICTGKYKLGDLSSPARTNLTEPILRGFCESKDTKTKFFIEAKINGKGASSYINFTSIFKDKLFGGTASKSSGMGSERQERGLIEIITNATLDHGMVKISSLKSSKGGVANVTGARKNEGMSLVGKEPYIDIFIDQSGGAPFGISCKGPSAPSLAGGGMAGLTQAVPDLVDKMYDTIISYIKTELKFKDKDVVDINQVPDVFIKIPDKYIKTILAGTEKMGGPVTHMYIGPMDVTGKVVGKNLNLNGSFYSIDDYMKKVPDLYFRIRKRDVDSEPNGQMMIDFSTKNREGYPVIFLGATRKKNLLRVVIADKPSGKAAVLTIK